MSQFYCSIIFKQHHTLDGRSAQCEKVLTVYFLGHMLCMSQGLGFIARRKLGLVHKDVSHLLFSLLACRFLWVCFASL